jgi:pimeloyl-ACP methyl ester carboxylesterase
MILSSIPAAACNRPAARGNSSRRGGRRLECRRTGNAVCYDAPTDFADLRTMTATTHSAAPPARSPARAASFDSRFIEANGVKLRYLDYGTAGRTPMLCLHGGAVNAHWFDFVAAGFTPDYHVRAFDQRGHGDSARADPPDYSYDAYAADLAEIVRKLDLRDFVLMGHSMGGLVSLIYAATYPGRAKKLVLIDSTLVSTPDRVALLHQVGAREGKSYASHDAFVENFRVRPAGTSAAPEILRYLAERSGREDADGLWRHKFDRNVYAKRVLIDIPPYWDRIEVPALYVKGARSNRITPEIAADARARCPRFELVEVPDADHHVTLDNPHGFVEVVRRWLATTS